MHLTCHRFTHKNFCLIRCRCICRRCLLKSRDPRWGIRSQSSILGQRKCVPDIFLNLCISERERAMLFPDYYFFSKRRLENYTIETRKVKNLDDCELMCYLNDNCVSLNFKKDPDNNEAVHICELNNATHLKNDSDLTSDANFYYRGSKVSYKLMFRNCRLGII